MDEHKACEEREKNIKPRSRRKIIRYDIDDELSIILYQIIQK